jgi:hypothetical protein
VAQAAALPNHFTSLHTTTPQPPAATTGTAVVEQGDDGGEDQSSKVLAHVASAWRCAPAGLAPLRPVVARALEAWPPEALAAHLAEDPPDGLRNPRRLLASRLADLPAGPGGCPCRGCVRWRGDPDAPPPKPPWCGTCDERTRLTEDDEGRPKRCPDCHPLVVGAAAS